MFKNINNIFLRIFAIIYNTLLEAVRNRAFLGLIIASALFLIFSIVLTELAVSDQAQRILVDFGLFSISLFSIIIAVTMGIILIYKEIEKKTFYLILPKPIHRMEVIIGKYLGLIFIIFLLLIFLTLTWFLCLSIKNFQIKPEYLIAVMLTFFEACLITAVAVFFSSFTSPILSGIFTAGFFVIGRTIYILEEMLLNPKSILQHKYPELKGIVTVIVNVFPNLDAFDLTHEMLLNLPVNPSYLLWSFIFSLSYSAIFLILAIFFFERKEFI
jgi:ABC-type transport system involved in multi-copper enzyme maturation permease subunit